MQSIQYDYASLSKEDLVRHCEAYSSSLHDLANQVMKLQWRLQMIERNREMFSNASA